MDFTSFYGKHILSGVDFSEQSIESSWGGDFENCQVCNFVLDGVVYSAIEDPNDGYRSLLRDIRIVDHTITNAFPPIEVLGSPMEVESNWGAEGVDFRDVANGKLVLSIGTENVDDYYPLYVARFTPENMSTNEGR